MNLAARATLLPDVLAHYSLAQGPPRSPPPPLPASALSRQLESLVVAHARLTQQEVPVLVVSYAQLLWDAAGFARRLKRFAPCVIFLLARLFSGGRGGETSGRYIDILDLG